MSQSFYVSSSSSEPSVNLNTAGRLCIACSKYINNRKTSFRSLGHLNSSRETATFIRLVHADMRPKWETCEFCLDYREPVPFIPPLFAHSPVEERYFHYSFKMIFDALPKDPVLEARVCRLGVISKEWANCRYCIPGLGHAIMGLLTDAHGLRPHVLFTAAANIESVTFFYLYLQMARKFLAKSPHGEHLCDQCLNMLRKTCQKLLLTALNVPLIVPDLFVKRLAKVIYAKNYKCPYGCMNISLIDLLLKAVLESGALFIHEIWNWLEIWSRLHLLSTENVAQIKLENITM